jgi:hypothetical protein
MTGGLASSSLWLDPFPVEHSAKQPWWCSPAHRVNRQAPSRLTPLDDDGRQPQLQVHHV